jgi:CubicO group peptidase (beta-lactamase class C family)
MAKKIIKRIAITILSIIVVLVIGLVLTGNSYLLKAVTTTYLTGHTSAFIDDYTHFDNRVIAAKNGEAWPLSEEYNKKKSTTKLDFVLKSTRSVAYLIIKNDSILFEHYFDGYNKDSKTNSFSMAKSIVAAALGKAIELGYIKNLEDKVITYLPDLKGEYAKDLSIKDLVTMQSGLQWDESYYSPFSITTKAYFYDNLSEAMLELPISSPPRQGYKYQSGDTQLLAMVLSKALPISLSEFVSKYFWQPMRAEHDALWQYNKKDGVEKAYCCIASNARDFARFGKLYMNKGSWNCDTILAQEYIEESIKPVDKNHPEYGYGWWLGTYKNKNTITMNGHLGQYVIAIPEDNVIIVRLGHRTDDRKLEDPEGDFYQYIDQAYEIMNKKSSSM